MFASPNGGRRSGPAPESSRKGCDVGVTQLVGDVFQGDCGAAKEYSRRIKANRIEKFPEACSVILQTPCERSSIHAEGTRHPVLADTSAGQQCAHHPLYAVYGNPALSKTLFLAKLRGEESMEKCVRADSRMLKECRIKHHCVAIGIEANRRGEVRENADVSDGAR